MLAPQVLVQGGAETRGQRTDKQKWDTPLSAGRETVLSSKEGGEQKAHTPLKIQEANEKNTEIAFLIQGRD